jgi:hypothetical protein
MKHPVLVSKDFVLYFEYVETEGIVVIFLHCDVRNWNKEVRTRLVSKYKHLASLQETHILAAIDKEDVKLKKFARLLGFEDFKYNIPIEDGTMKDIMLWKDK